MPAINHQQKVESILIASAFALGYYQDASLMLSQKSIDDECLGYVYRLMKSAIDYKVSRIDSVFNFGNIHFSYIENNMDAVVETIYFGIKSKIGHISGFGIVLNPLLINNNGILVLGNNVQFGYGTSPLFHSNYSQISVKSINGRVSIGDNTLINNGFQISSESDFGVEIGANCLIGTNFQCADSDFHSLNPLERKSGIPKMAGVFIGENVFIGSDVSVLKGTRIGKDCVVAAGSICNKIYPDGSIIAGIPAKEIGSVYN
jgi:maltose O-acetyltransferase